MRKSARTSGASVSSRAAQPVRAAWSAPLERYARECSSNSVRGPHPGRVGPERPQVNRLMMRYPTRFRSALAVVDQRLPDAGQCGDVFDGKRCLS